jgi:hypothetical protein
MSNSLFCRPKRLTLMSTLKLSTLISLPVLLILLGASPSFVRSMFDFSLKQENTRPLMANTNSKFAQKYSIGGPKQLYSVFHTFSLMYQVDYF